MAYTTLININPQFPPESKFLLKRELSLTVNEIKQMKAKCFPHSIAIKKQNLTAKYTISKKDQRKQRSIKQPTLQFIHNELNNKFRRFFNDKKRILKRKSVECNNTQLLSKQLKYNMNEKSEIKNSQSNTNFFQVNKIKNKEIIDIDIESPPFRYKIFKSEQKQSMYNQNQFQVLTISKFRPQTQKMLVNSQDKEKHHNQKQIIKPYKQVSIHVNSPHLNSSQCSMSKSIIKNIQKKINKSEMLRMKQQQKKIEKLTNLNIVLFKRQKEQKVYLTNLAIFQNCKLNKQQFGYAYSILHLKNNQSSFLLQHNSEQMLQIASLTKIMTCLLIFFIAQKFFLNLRVQTTKVSHKASCLKGTTANLLYGDQLSIYDLLHGLMLPSGNDAAVALAEWGGKMIRYNCRKIQPPHSPVFKPGNASFKKSNIWLFIYHMNKISKSLKLSGTHFANVHGLMNKKNYSCAKDLIKLSAFCMETEEFRQIVNKKVYKCMITNKKYKIEREQIWRNTNKLLKIDNYCGIKTGITPTAGPCLISCYKISENEQIYIVLLKSLSANDRFEQSKKLLIECLKNLYSNTNNKIYLRGLAVLLQNPNFEADEQIQDSNNIQVTEDEQNYQEQKNSDIQL